MPVVNQPESPVELHVDELACRRGRRLLFDGLSWTARSGTLVMVRGSNGAGKTSLLRLIAGLGIPERGTVRWRGDDVAQDMTKLHADLAWIGHADGLKMDLSPRENLEFHHALNGSRQDLDAAIQGAGLAAYADIPCRALSAGQRRRTALARLRVADARLWVLDEPMTALDADAQAMVQQMVSAHCRGGGIAVVTSHQPFSGDTTLLEVSL
jgi:heme exporter protein A